MSKNRALPIRRKGPLAVASVFVMLAASACGSSSESASKSSGCEPSGKIKSIAMLLPGKKTDPGFSGTGYSGLAAAAKKYCLKTAVVESADVSTQAETYNSFAEQKFDLIVGWGGQFEDGARDAAEKFPDTFFGVTNGVSSNDSNLASIDFAGEQWTFLTGYLAAKMSKSGQVAFIGGPCFDAVARYEHGFRDGAKYGDPDVKVSITALDSFDDPIEAGKAAKALISQGVDMIFPDLNSGQEGVWAALRAANKEGKGGPYLGFGTFTDQHEDAPDVIVTSAVRDLAELVGTLVDNANKGDFGQAIRVPLTADYDALTPFHGLADEALLAEAKDVQAKIATGEIKVEANGNCPY